MPANFYYNMPPDMAVTQLNQLSAESEAARQQGISTANQAVSAALQAATYRDQAISAWQAGASPMESLAAFSQSIHYGNSVASAIYDTSRDSDGGAWRKRCPHTSWYNEAICSGSWLQQKANELAARGDNALAYPEQFDNAVWVKRGTCSVTPNQAVAPDGTTSMDLIAGLGTAGTNDIYQSFGSARFTAGTRIDPSVYIQKVSQAGTVTLQNTNSASKGLWAIDLSKLGSGVERITRSHPAVTVTTEFTSSGTADEGLHFACTSGAPASIYAWGAKINKVGEQSSTYSGSPELVVNGKFDIDTSSWTAANAATLSADAGRLKITNTSGAANGYASQALTTVAGKTYRLSVDYDRGASTTTTFAYVGTAAGASNLASASSGTQGNPASGVFELVFTATGAQTYLSLIIDAVAGHIGYFDNVTLKEVTTLATPYVPYSQLVGSFYQNTTDGKYYSLNATYGQTEVFRGNKREFPAVAGIVVESARVVIYDLTAPGCPMWMVFKCDSASNFWGSSATATSVLAVNGQIVVGCGSGLRIADFARDEMRAISTVLFPNQSGGVSNRNGAINWTGRSSTVTIVAAPVNSIAATVLPTAPVDPATGLQVPTIAVGTDGGTSILKDDGTVVNGGQSNATWPVRNVVFDKWNRLWATAGDEFYGAAQIMSDPPYTTVAGMGLGTRGYPQIGGNLTYGANSAWPYTLGRQTKWAVPVGPGLGTKTGVTMLKENVSNPVKTMVAYITNAYNTGWMVGDIRGAWLADTVAESITGTELVTNGTFTTDASGWTPYDAATTISVVNGALRLTVASGSNGADASTPLATTIGRRYTAVALCGAKTAGSVDMYAGNVAGNASLGSVLAQSTTGILTFSFTATATTTYLTLSANGAAGVTADFDNVSVRPTVEDRCVKNKAMQLFGTLTKTAVAAGSQLMAYSGFSAVNFVEQAYNTDLDFPGDFHYRLWGTMPTAGQPREALTRGAAAAGAVLLERTAAGNLAFYIHNGTSYTALPYPTAAAPTDANFHCIDVYRVGSTLTLAIDNAVVASVTNAQSAVCPNAVLRLGEYIGTSIPWTGGSLTLVRASATVPSLDQLAQMYRDELALFQPGAQCLIDGNSAAVTALAYDDLTDLLHVGTSWGRSAFKGLQRVESSATSVGAVQSIAAANGAHITAGASSSRFGQPSITVREELRNRDEAKRAAAQIARPFWFTGDGTKKDFTLPYGWQPVDGEVTKQGMTLREGGTYDYTTTFDGYRWTVSFIDAPFNNHNVCIKGTRNG